jgi:hypothetical protein
MGLPVLSAGSASQSVTEFVSMTVVRAVDGTVEETVGETVDRTVAETGLGADGDGAAP